MQDDYYANVAFKVGNTMSENASVKRVVLYFDNSKKLKYIVKSKIEKIDVISM